MSRSHRIAYTEVAGWNHSEHWIGFETIRSKRIYLSLQILKKPDRVRVIERLRSMDLGEVGSPGITQRDVDRARWKNLRIAIGCTVVLAAFAYWYIFHYGVTPPDEYYMSLERCEESGPATERYRECFAEPDVGSYLRAAQDRVLEDWRLPRGVSADQGVELRFRLHADGTIRCLSLMQEWDEALARSVISAVERAAPFDPLPVGAMCLSEVPIVATFANPSSPPTSTPTANERGRVGD
jgi:hypothetical protein